MKSVTQPAEIAVKMAHAWARLGKRDRAIAGFKQVLAEQPEHLPATLELIDALHYFERHTEIQQWAERGLLHHPDCAELHKALIDAIVAKSGIAAAFARYQLSRIDTRPLDIAQDEIIACLVQRNELHRLPHFFKHYRRLGVDRFFVVDNHSDDESTGWLLQQSDVHLWYSDYSFGASNFGSAWFELLLRRYACDHWCLTLDADELLVYPDFEHRSLRALCAILDNAGKRVLGASLLDMYSDRAIADTVLTDQSELMGLCPYFDRQWYQRSYPDAGPYNNQTVLFGGVRERVFGEDTQVYLTKTPLLRYDTDCILGGGQHWTNRPKSEIVDQGAVVLHFKFLSTFLPYVRAEIERGEHYDDAYQYKQYAETLASQQTLTLFHPDHSVRYEDSRQLVRLGVMHDFGVTGTRRPAHAPPIAAVPAEIERPFWSVMVTVYRRTHLLERALRSVVEQPNSAEMQIVVVQDYSGGDTEIDAAIADTVARLGHGQVTLVRREHNAGHPEIFNECIRLAIGQWIHILHDDDWVEPGFYATLQAGLEHSAAGSAFCRHTIVQADGSLRQSRFERETAGLLADWLPLTAQLCRQEFSATVVKRSLFEELGGFADAAGSAFDWEMWQRAATYYPVYFEPQSLANSRSDGSAETDTLQQTGQHIRDSLKAVKLAQIYLPDKVARSAARTARRRLADFALWTAEQQLDQGQYRAAISNIGTALDVAADRKTVALLKKIINQQSV